MRTKGERPDAKADDVHLAQVRGCLLSNEQVLVLP